MICLMVFRQKGERKLHRVIKMDNKTNTYFFDLIKIAVEKKDALSGTPTLDEWIGIYTLAKEHTLVGILFSAIEKLPKEQRPPRPILLKWFAATEIIQEKNTKANIDAVKLCEAIRKDGFRCVVLKGQGIATYYPNPSLRQCGDIDLWIEGGTKKVLNYLRSKGPVTNIVYTHLDAEVPVDTEVEIHHNPTFFYNPIFLNRLHKYLNKQDEIFNNYVNLSDGTGKICIPTLEFNRYFIILHIYRHYFSEGIGLRQLMDYYYVLKKEGTDESKQRTLEMFKQTGMMKFVAATMWVMQQVFGLEERYMLCTPNEKAGKKLMEEIMLSGNFGMYDTRLNRSNHHKLFPRVWESIKRKIRFVLDYPQEILFDIPMRTYMYIWKHFV